MGERTENLGAAGQLQEEQQIFNEHRRRNTNACMPMCDIRIIYNHPKWQSGCFSVIKGMKKLYTFIEWNIIQHRILFYEYYS